MSDLFEEPQDPGRNTPEYSVSELSGEVKRAVERGFAHVRVRGEVGRVSRPRSGHIYMDLKDDRAVLAGVIWKGQAAKLATLPEEGLDVIATGRLTTFPGQSKYQMIIEDIAPAGVGALMAMLEKRKKALEAEGLFAPERKAPLPYLPEIIGVITSPSGAVIRDILHRLQDRFPRKVLVWPVAVQGAACASEVARAIDGFNRLTPGGALPRPDLLIVARGGGSLEDLWGFNEEIVVRAAAASRIPLISAVGHETDTTLIDFASDRRAPTPTAAAEMAVPVRLDLLTWVDHQGSRLTRAAGHAVSSRQQRVRDLARALPRPETLAEGPRQRLDMTADRLPRALKALARDRKHALSTAAHALHPVRLRDRLSALAEHLASHTGRLDRGLQQSTTRQRAQLDALGARLPRARQLALARQRTAFDTLANRLSLHPVQRQISFARDMLERQSARLPLVTNGALRDQRQRLTALDRVHQSFDHSRVLDRGFVLVRDGDGTLMTRKTPAEGATSLELEFADGRMTITRSGTAPRKPTRKSKPPTQGSLFGDE